MNSESNRIAFIEARDGKDAAMAFARQTMIVYRKAVLMSRKRGHAKPHHASLPEYRAGFISSYLCFKQYLLVNS